MKKIIFSLFFLVAVSGCSNNTYLNSSGANLVRITSCSNPIFEDCYITTSIGYYNGYLTKNIGIEIR